MFMWSVGPLQISGDPPVICCRHWRAKAPPAGPLWRTRVRSPSLVSEMVSTGSASSAVQRGFQRQFRYCLMV